MRRDSIAVPAFVLSSVGSIVDETSRLASSRSVWCPLALGDFLETPRDAAIAP